LTYPRSIGLSFACTTSFSPVGTISAGRHDTADRIIPKLLDHAVDRALDLRADALIRRLRQQLLNARDRLFRLAESFASFTLEAHLPFLQPLNRLGDGRPRARQSRAEPLQLALQAFDFGLQPQMLHARGQSFRQQRRRHLQALPGEPQIVGGRFPLRIKLLDL
jgi:hypothetical protein